MKIRMLSSISGLDYSLSRNDETERFSDAEALRLIVSGAAVLVSGQSVETAVAQNAAVETAVINNIIADATAANDERVTVTRKGKAI